MSPQYPEFIVVNLLILPVRSKHDNSDSANLLVELCGMQQNNGIPHQQQLFSVSSGAPVSKPELHIL